MLELILNGLGVLAVLGVAWETHKASNETRRMVEVLQANGDATNRLLAELTRRVERLEDRGDRDRDNN